MEAAPAAEERNPFAAERFPRWWTASLFAGTGVGIQAVTVPLFLRDRVDADERALVIAAALIAQTLPGALLALLGGVIADRVERRRILVRTYGVAAAVSVAYVLLAALEVREIWPVFPLAALVGAAGAFTNPARQSLLPQIVGPSQLQNGVIFGTMGFMATLQFLGPMTGGIVTEAAGLQVAFGLETLFLLAAALLFAGVRAPAPTPSGRSVGADLREGLSIVRGRPTLLGLLAMAAMPGIVFIGPFAVTVPILVPDVFGAGDKWVGILWGCFGAGVFVCSLLLAAVRLRMRGLAICLAMVSGGVTLLFYAGSETLTAATVVLFVWGCSAAVFINYVVALLQENTEPQYMGRVMSMYSLAFLAAAPLGHFQAGVLTTAFGPTTTLLTSGVAAIVVGSLCAVFLRPVRDLR